MPTMLLPCNLTTDDRLRISEVQTAEITAREGVEATKREAVRGFNVTLKTHRQREHDFNESLRTGTELREVEIEERPDFAAGVIHVHRLDTGDVVKIRAIDPDERQVKLGIDGPKPMDGGKPDATDEQRAAQTPEEAEALRTERLAGERAERISAAVVEARGRITVLPFSKFDGVGATFSGFTATLQFGNAVVEASADDEETARHGVVVQVTEILEAQEDQAATWTDVAAASQAEQDRQEVERLAAEQAKDEATTPKRGFVKGLRAPRKKKGHPVELPDGRVVDPEEEVAKLDAAEPPTPGDDGPVATGKDDGELAF